VQNRVTRLVQYVLTYQPFRRTFTPGKDVSGMKAEMTRVERGIVVIVGTDHHIVERYEGNCSEMRRTI
jgi:hypothetical protein